MWFLTVFVSYRLSAAYSGAFLMNRSVDEIVMSGGKVEAVKSEGKASAIIVEGRLRSHCMDVSKNDPAAALCPQ